MKERMSKRGKNALKRGAINMKNKGDGQNVMRCRVEFDRKKWRVSLERRDQDS